MKPVLLVFLLATLMASGQEVKKVFVGKEQPGATLEHFILRNGRNCDGIWDAARSQIHIVQNSNHVGNLTVKTDEILTRKSLGDGSQVKLYSDVDVAEQVVLRLLQGETAARNRLAVAQKNRDNLHATYGHKDLPRAQYNAVMARYKAADDEVAAAEKAIEATRAAFPKALEAYQKAGGKTQYQLP
jgi:hypothetical protein